MTVSPNGIIGNHMLNNYALQSFTVGLAKSEVLHTVSDLHSLFNCVFTGDVLLIQSDRGGRRVVSVTGLETGEAMHEPEAQPGGISPFTRPDEDGDRRSSSVHAIIDTDGAYEHIIDDLRPSTAVVLAETAEGTSVTVAVVAGDRARESLGQAVETALLAVVQLPESVRRDAEQRETTVRAAFDEAAPPAHMPGGRPDGFISRFERLAREEPELVAVRTTEGTMTYSELSRAARALAGRLAAQDQGERARILILPRRGVSMITTLLAAFMTGCTVSIIDPRHPDAYITACVDVFDPHLVIDLAGRAPAWRGLPTLSEEDIDGATRGQEPMRVAGEIFDPDDCAIVTFTSGTTGVPKAVAGRYSSLTYFFPWMDAEFGPFRGARFGMCSSIGHDPLQRDIMTPLYLGGSISIPDEDILDQPVELGRWLKQQRIEAVCLNPVLVNALDQEDGGLPDIRLFLCVGAALTRQQALRVRRLAPGGRILNLYGSTETQRAVAYFEVPHDLREIEQLPPIVPLGVGMKDVSVIVLSPDGRRCMPFEMGEIAICSSQIGLGYLGNPELTREKFKTDLPGLPPGARVYMTGDSGYLTPNLGAIYAGRGDDQVKINGYRVELEEINSACRTHPQVRDTATITMEIDGFLSLVTFLVPTDESLEFASKGFRQFLAKRLPRYAVPHHVITRNGLPLTMNRKVDFAALRDEAAERFGARTTDAIAGFISRHAGETQTPDDVPLWSLGIDSLRFTSLVTQLVPDVTARSRLRLQNTMTIREIRAALSAMPMQHHEWDPGRSRPHVRLSAAQQYGPITRISETEISFGARTLAHCCSNSYLGMGSRMDGRSLLREFTSMGLPIHSHGSGEVNAHTVHHQNLVDSLCELHGTESAMLFSSAYLANTSVIPALARVGDRIFVDESAHRSILDGCVLSGAQIHVFRHNDVGHLISLLEQEGDAVGRKLIITEGVFSVEGDIAALPGVSEVARRHGCLLLVDEACSLGHIGRSGRGLEEHFGMGSVIDLHIGTLSKALASSGGYVAGSRKLVELLRFQRGAAFSSGLSPFHAFLAHRSAEELIKNGTEMVGVLRVNAEIWRTSLTEAGVTVGDSQTAIVPIMCDDAEEVHRLHTAMMDAGIFGIPVTYPWSSTINAVRTSVTASHDGADLAQLAARVADAALLK